MPVLVQVNVAREPQKGGVYLEDYESLMDAVSRLPGVSVRGLMAIMPISDHPEELRGLFRQMRTLFERERDRARQFVTMDILSMGMTHDYLVAASEGATMVRLGHAIFADELNPQREEGSMALSNGFHKFLDLIGIVSRDEPVSGRNERVGSSRGRYDDGGGDFSDEECGL